MVAVDMAKSFKAEFHVFIGVLFHDLGKGTTPVDILPHHYKHELRSFDLVTDLMEDHRFPKKTKEFSIMFAKLHMRMNIIEDLSAKKLVRYLVAIPKKFHHDFLIAARSDTSSVERPGVEEKGIKLFEAAKDVVVGLKFSPFPIDWDGEKIKQDIHSTRVSALKHRMKDL